MHEPIEEVDGPVATVTASEPCNCTCKTSSTDRNEVVANEDTATNSITIYADINNPPAGG